MVYCPERTIQQYCMTCSKWFDWDCIAQRAVDQPLLELKTSSITATKILRMPIERSALEFEAEGWRVTGNRAMVIRVLGWYRSGTFPNNWKAQLGGSFIKYAKNTIFTYYQCPGCETII